MCRRHDKQATPTGRKRTGLDNPLHWCNCCRVARVSPRRRAGDATEAVLDSLMALSRAVIALTTNLAIAKGGRIDFAPEWFDVDSDATPDGSKPASASNLAKS